MRYFRITCFLIALLVFEGLVVSSAFAQILHDLDSRIIIRRAPIMPPTATRSGTCELRYDITPEGLTTNIHVLRCTETLFARASARSLRRWTYKPADKARVGVEVKITYRMVGEDGQMLPAAPMPRRIKNPIVPASLKSGKKKIKSKRKLADNFCCLNYSVGADGSTFNRKWGVCPYKGSRTAVAERLTKMRFTPATDEEGFVVSDGYQSVFWFYKDKAYTGSDEDSAKCTVQ